MNARVRAAGALARVAGSLSRLAGRGGGTTIPGHLFLRLAPEGLRPLAERLGDGVAMISATNGKTTTAAMLSMILASDRTICRNGSGANLVSGIATTLATCPAGATVGVLEVDEAALPALATAITPRLIALGNLYRDQLDRHGELEMIADRWRVMVAGIAPETALVLCADDPVIDDLGRDRVNVLRYGIDDSSVALSERDHAADSTFCVRCGAPYDYDAVYLGHLGKFHCPSCDHARGLLDVAARDIRFDGVRGTTFRLDAPDGVCQVRLSLPGIYNVENALAAITSALVLGVPSSVSAERLLSFDAAFGRFQRIDVAGRQAVLLLFKNPTGANEALRAIRSDIAGAQIVMGLNDRIADGRDVSWIWDIDLEHAFAAAAGIICAGLRAAELTLRLRYADVDPKLITIQEDITEAFDRAVAAAPVGGRVYVLATYTAMLDLHRELSRRDLTRPFWEDLT